MNTSELQTLTAQRPATCPGVPVEAALTVNEVCRLLHVSKAWLYSPAGKAAVGAGFKLGGSRRYRSSVIATVLSA
jgi:hypothetical protein